MNKTIFNLDVKVSIMIVSILGIILSFLSNGFYVNSVLNFVFYVFRCILFVTLFVVFYMSESNNLQFKDALKRMVGYLIITEGLNLVCSVFVVTHLLRGVFVTISGIVCFLLIFTFVIEILNIYFSNKFIKVIFNINEKIGLKISNPIISFIESKITND